MTALRFSSRLAAFLGMLGACLPAAESANYTMNHADFGGAGRSSAGPYSQDAAFVPCGGIFDSPGDNVVARVGYIGQLADAVSVEVTMLPEDVPELSTAQLAAALVLDDGSQTVLDPDEVVWDVKHGPINGVSTQGLLETSTVYQDTPAEVQAEHPEANGSLPFTVLDTDDDNFGTYSGDGLEDAWQVLHFGLDNPKAKPTADPDGDGQNNHFEWTAGIDPLDPQARFILQIEAASPTPGQMNLVFSPLVPGRVYRVFHGPSLDAIVTPLASDPPVDFGNERTLTDPATTDPRRFYRVEITRE